MDEENAIYTHNSALKKKEILSFAMTCVSLEDIMLSEIRQALHNVSLKRGI
jgi:hypothetical protein